MNEVVKGEELFHFTETTEGVTTPGVTSPAVTTPVATTEAQTTIERKFK